MQQIKTSEKVDFEYRHKSKCIASFETFAPSGFCCKEETRHLFKLNVNSKTIFVEWDLDWRNQTSPSGKTLVWKMMLFITKTFSAFPDIKILMQEWKKNSSTEPSTTTVELSTDTLMGETKPVATQNMKFEDSVKSVSKSDSGTLIQSRLWCKEHNRLILNRLICHHSKEIDWHLDGTNQAYKFGENWVWTSS